MSDDRPQVVKANALIEASYRLTLSETRVLLAAIAQVRRDEAPTDAVMYEVRANALADVSGIALKEAYEQLQTAVQRLENRRVRLFSGPNDEGSPRIRSTVWVQTVDYIESEGRIQLRFSKDVLPYLTQLREQYTRYELANVATMRSTYGVRLYELCQQWRQHGEREIEIEDVRRLFGVEQHHYKAIKDLKKRVIEPAVRDVNKCSDLTVTWGQRKRGRNVAAIQFQFTPKHLRGQSQKQKRPDRRHDGRLTRLEIERLAKPGESYDTAERRIEAEIAREVDI